jgi:phospholipid N-methyltransferase
MKKWTELEDKLILDSIPEDGVFTKELALILKRQLPDRTVRSIKQHYYDKLKKEWLENKVKEAEAVATATKLSFWQKFINLFKSK